MEQKPGGVELTSRATPDFMRGAPDQATSRIMSQSSPMNSGDDAGHTDI